jgi:hypothetical protein
VRIPESKAKPPGVHTKEHTRPTGTDTGNAKQRERYVNTLSTATHTTHYTLHTHTHTQGTHVLVMLVLFDDVHELVCSTFVQTELDKLRVHAQHTQYLGHQHEVHYQLFG